MFNYLNDNIIKTTLSIIFFILIVLIINNEIVGKIIWWFPDLFGDLKTPIKWLECHNNGLNYYNDKAAFTVENVPLNGSTTKSPISVVDLIILCRRTLGI